LDAVDWLNTLLRGSHKGQALAAYEQLVQLKENDDSQRVRLAAKQCVEQYDALAKAEQRLETEKAEAPERERRARERAEQEKRAAEDAEQERLGREQAAAEGVAKEKAEQEGLALEKAEAGERERLARRLRAKAREKAAAVERERLEQAEAERQAHYQEEQERLARARGSAVEKERVAHEDAEVEVQAREKVETEHERPAWKKAAVELLLARSNLRKVIGIVALFLSLVGLFVHFRSANNADWFLQSGLSLANKGDNDGAIVAYRKAIELGPNIPDLHNDLGVSLQAKGDIDGAIAEYREALRLNPDFTKASANLAPLVRKQEQALEESSRQKLR
jgi:tetratricopeptide (TPR) repeat protein